MASSTSKNTKTSNKSCEQPTTTRSVESTELHKKARALEVGRRALIKISRFRDAPGHSAQAECSE
jgi:hypothetical protein